PFSLDIRRDIHDFLFDSSIRFRKLPTTKSREDIQVLRSSLSCQAYSQVLPDEERNNQFKHNGQMKHAVRS
ncbi:28266_t:CDS:2, partial [Dentiscutata erythropus]